MAPLGRKRLSGLAHLPGIAPEHEDLAFTGVKALRRELDHVLGRGDHAEELLHAIGTFPAADGGIVLRVSVHLPVDFRRERADDGGGLAALERVVQLPDEPRIGIVHGDLLSGRCHIRRSAGSRDRLRASMPAARPAAVHSMWLRNQLRVSSGKSRTTATEIVNPSRQMRPATTRVGNDADERMPGAARRPIDDDDGPRDPRPVATDRLTSGPAFSAVLGAAGPPAPAAARDGPNAAVRGPRGRKEAGGAVFFPARALPTSAAP